MPTRSLFLVLFLSLLASSLVASQDSTNAEEPGYAETWTSAAERGDVEVLRRLLLAGQDIDETSWAALKMMDLSYPFRTALMRAAMAGEVAAARFLLEEGAVPSTRASPPGLGLLVLGPSAREIAQTERATRMKERAGKSRSWKEQNPEEEDAKLKGLSAIVELLKKAEAAQRQAALYELVTLNPKPKTPKPKNKTLKPPNPIPQP